MMMMMIRNVIIIIMRNPAKLFLAFVVRMLSVIVACLPQMYREKKHVY